MAASTETLTFSNLYPNRPIRPLPKRRLRERLSPEVAETISYPPSTRPTSIFYPPYPTDISEEYRRHEPATAGGPGDESGDEVRQFVGAGSGRQNGAHLEVTEDDQESRSAIVPRPPPEISNAYSGQRQQPKTDHTRHTGAILPPSDLSGDGYESFENTNNKKKRKTPTAGDSSIGRSHAIPDGGTVPVSAGLAAAHIQGDGTANSQYAALNGSSANNKGISGAGRGMFGRARNGRSPLRTLSNANNWTDRNSKPRPGRQWGAPSAESPTGGIISSAIAKAGKDSTQQGQENVSLLQHSAINRTSPASTQFTFTCESQVPGTYRGDLSSGLPPPGYIPGKGPTIPHGMGAMNDQGAGRHDALPKGGSQGSTGRQRRSRKSIDRELEDQARQRRAKTQENRRRNPVPLEEEWVCDFCIYESIWGEPPAAIIRAYEERERRERIAEMNKKRRLEQVKARSRKSKKQPKNSGGKPGNVAKAHHDAAEHDAHAAVHEDVGSEADDVTSEEYVDESFHPLDEVDDGDLSPIPGDVHDYTHNGYGQDGGGGVGRRGGELHGPAK